jgi:acyl carrier protein
MPETLDIQSIRGALRDFLESEILAPGVGFDDATPLAELGVDSMSLVQLTLFIERRFGLIIPDDQLTRTNLATLDSLAACVERLAAGEGP